MTPLPTPEIDRKHSSDALGLQDHAILDDLLGEEDSIFDFGYGESVADAFVTPPPLVRRASPENCGVMCHVDRTNEDMLGVSEDEFWSSSIDMLMTTLA